MGCMAEKGSKSACEHCGFDEKKQKKHPSYLELRTVLNNKYVIGKVIGHGGFGITYLAFEKEFIKNKAFEKELLKKVAIKEYFPSALASRDTSDFTIYPLKGDQEDFFKEGLNFFIEEARNVAQFSDHPNIVNIYDFFEDHGTGYMVMEYIDGDNLKSLIDNLIKNNEQMSYQEAKTLLLPVLSALKYIHSKNLYHRDISPHNIIIRKDRTPVLIDFGAARYIIGEQSRSLDVVLKPGFSPYESFTSNGKIGSWTDVYGCGATLYYMLTGIVPPQATDRLFRDELKQPSEIKSLKKEINNHINNTILHSLAVKMDDRFKTVNEFEDALLKESTGTSIIEKNESDTSGPKKLKKISLFLFCLISLLVAMIGVYEYTNTSSIMDHFFESDPVNVQHSQNTQHNGSVNEQLDQGIDNSNIQTPLHYSFTVNIYPPAAVKDGAMWKVNDGDWKNINDRVQLNSEELYTISFKNIVDWITPKEQYITGNKNSMDALYKTIEISSIRPVDYASIKVIILPYEINQKGAKWRIKGHGEWMNSGEIKSNLMCQTYTIKFKYVEEWKKPDNIQVMITNPDFIVKEAIYSKWNEH